MIESIGPEKALGDFVRLKGSSPRHFTEPEVGQTEERSFSEVLLDGLKDVNDKQQEFSALTQKAIVDPESVDPHDITIAMAESSMSLNIAKNVIDRVLRGYREITSLR